LRYRNLLVRQSTQMKNKVSGLLMESGIEYSKQSCTRSGIQRVAEAPGGEQLPLR